MRKLTALLCTAAMTFTMAATAFAAGSIPGAGVENSAGAVVGNPGITVVVAAADTTKFTSVTAKAGVDYLKNTETPTMAGLCEAFGVDPAEPVTLEGGKVVVPAEYEPLMKEFITVDTDAEVELVGDEKVLVTLNAELLKDANPEDLLIMTVDPDSGEVGYVEIKAEDLNAATGELKIELPFPCTFTILEKSAVANG